MGFGLFAALAPQASNIVGGLFGGGGGGWSNSEYAQILRGEPDNALYVEFKKVSRLPQYMHRAPIARAELERRGIDPNTGQKYQQQQQQRQTGARMSGGVSTGPTGGFKALFSNFYFQVTAGLAVLILAVVVVIKSLGKKKRRR